MTQSPCIHRASVFSVNTLSLSTSALGLTYRPFQGIAILVILCVLVASAHAQALLYHFNESGIKATNSGSAGRAFDLTLCDKAWQPTDLHGLFGGTGAEKSLDLTSSNGMGRKATPGNPSAYNIHVGKLFDGLTSFTVCGWFYSSEIPGNAARIFQTGAIVLMWEAGQLVFQYDSDIVTSESKVGKNITHTHGFPLKCKTPSVPTFFAVTYSFNESSNTKTITFYLGDNTNDPLPNPYQVIFNPTSKTLRELTTFVIGGNYLGIGNERPFNGYIDDFAVYTEALNDEAIRDIFLKSKH